MGTQVVDLATRRKGRPATVLGKVPPPKVPNLDKRPREHLTSKEMERLIKAAKQNGRHGDRDSTLILMGFRHALRVSELVDLRWSQVDFEGYSLHVNRRKNGRPSTHPLTGDETRALRKLRKRYGDSEYLFVTERQTPLTTSSVRKIVARAGEKAKLELSVHPHMLRHSTGFYLANNGIDTRSIQAYMGHQNIQNTVRYTELSPGRFKGFFKD